MPYPSGPFTGDYTVGNYAQGNKFADCKASDGELIRSIKVYTGDTVINGIQYTFTGGKSITHGHLSGDKTSSVDLSVGETITRVELFKYWGTGNIARMRMTTSNGKTLDCGRDKSVDLYAPNVASGYLAGFTGSEGSGYLHSLGCIFLIQVEKVLVHNVTYPEVPTTEGIESISLLDVTYDNTAGTRDQTYHFNQSISRTNTATFSSGTTASFGSKVSIEAGVPTLVKAVAETSWSISTTSSHSVTESKNVTFDYGTDPVVSPGEIMDVSAMCKYGHLDVEYVADVRVTFPDGQKIEYQETGTLQNAQYDYAYVSTTPRKP